MTVRLSPCASVAVSWISRKVVVVGAQVLGIRAGDRNVVAGRRRQERVGVSVVVLDHRPAQPARRQRALLRVGCASRERDHLTHGEALARGRRIDRGHRRRIARVDADSGSVLAAAAISDTKGRRVGSAGRVRVGRRGARRMWASVTEVPVVGQGVAVGIAAARPSNDDREGNGPDVGLAVATPRARGSTVPVKAIRRTSPPFR